MATNITLLYCGMAGQGATVREAKADAARRIEALIKDLDQAPTVLTLGADAVLVWCQPEGWTYRHIVDLGKVRAGSVYGNCGGAGYSRADALRAAQRHLLDSAWSLDCPDDAAWLESALDSLQVAPRDRSEIGAESARRMKWQRDYRAARDAGMDDEDARYVAGGCSHLVKPRAATAPVIEFPGC